MANKIHRKLTKEQIEFREKILNVKPKPTKEKAAPLPPKIITRNEYMNNCMFFINEFESGRTSKKYVVKSATYLRNYCNQIIEENLKVY